MFVIIKEVFEMTRYCFVFDDCIGPFDTSEEAYSWIKKYSRSYDDVIYKVKELTMKKNHDHSEIS